MFFIFYWMNGNYLLSGRHSENILKIDFIWTPLHNSFGMLVWMCFFLFCLFSRWNCFVLEAFNFNSLALLGTHTIINTGAGGISMRSQWLWLLTTKIKSVISKKTKKKQEKKQDAAAAAFCSPYYRWFIKCIFFKRFVENGLDRWWCWTCNTLNNINQAAMTMQLLYWERDDELKLKL